MKQWAGALLVTKENKLILQKRDDKPGIFNSGMITLFGGGVEPGENIREAALREIKEEVDVTVLDNQLLTLASYQKNIREHGDDCLCHVFIVKNVNPKSITVLEGEGYVLVDNHTPLSEDMYSHVTIRAIKDYYKM